MLAVRRALGEIPARLASPARWLASKLRTRRLEKLVGALGRPLEEMLVANPAFVDEQLARNACVLEREWAWSSRHGRLAEARKHGADLFAWLFYLDLTQYLVSLLERQDKMSMAAGIESRVPFLDYRVVQLALRTSDEHKVSLSATKVIVKKLAERYLPRSIIYQRKSGFGVPLAQWFRNRKGLGRYLDYLASSPFRRRGIWNVPAVDRCVDEHMAARKDHSELLWVLLNLELWSTMYLDRDGTGVLS
jgi:asparagine synthase (glutamine-hydrolysing)